MNDENRSELRDQREQQIEEGRRRDERRYHLTDSAIKTAHRFGVCIFILVALVQISNQYLSYLKLVQDAAMNRAELEIDRMRSEKSGAALENSSQRSGNLPSVDPRTGLSLFREVIEKTTFANSNSASGKSGSIMSGLLDLVDGFNKAGVMAAQDAFNLKDEIQRAGINITEDAAKTLIKKYIEGRPQEKEKSVLFKTGGERSGISELNFYCGDGKPAAHLAPKPNPPKKVVPKSNCCSPDSESCLRGDG